MKQREFDKLVAEGFERLPQWVREKIKNVAILVEDEPSDAVRESEGRFKERNGLMNLVRAF